MLAVSRCCACRARVAKDCGNIPTNAFCPYRSGTKLQKCSWVKAISSSSPSMTRHSALHLWGLQGLPQDLNTQRQFGLVVITSRTCSRARGAYPHPGWQLAQACRQMSSLPVAAVHGSKRTYGQIRIISVAGGTACHEAWDVAFSLNPRF